MKFINESEYNRLYAEKMFNPLIWELQPVDILIDKFVNRVFENNRFLFEIFFFSEYNILNYNSRMSNINFEHTCCIKFKSGFLDIEGFETVTGIVTFPYINWNIINDYISDLPSGWSLFVINPCLIKYNPGSIGIFLTPTYAKNIFIDEFNNFIKSKTGYPLFLKYTNNQNISKIIFEKPDLSLKNFIKEMKKHGNRSLEKLLDFWADNKCVDVSSFEYAYDNYKNNLSYPIWEDIDLKNISSSVSFKIVHENNSEISGIFKKFSLDKAFHLAYVDQGVLKLTDSQINDLIDGKYDFKLCR